MESGHIKALETRLMWLRWSKEQGRQAWESIQQSRNRNKNLPIPTSLFTEALPQYEAVLESGDTFFMNDRFCSLVDHARQTVPDDLVFEHTWMQAEMGWMWIASPFSVPDLQGLERGMDIKVAAIGWFKVPQGTKLDAGRVATEGSYNILCFQNFANYNPRARGFGAWSYFTLIDGDKLIDRVHAFENKAQIVADGGAYVVDRTTDKLHEIRWVYTAFYLMAQKLATTVNHPTDRSHRRRAEREELPAPPFIRVVTLRRLETERKDDNRSPEHIDWQWQWDVRPHWRNQFFPSSGEHHPVYIETYLKGPDDKPIKPPSHKLFLARR